MVVSAIRTRDCHREVFDVIEVTERRGLRMGGAEDPRVTEPARGVVTARAQMQSVQLKYRRKGALAMRPESLEQ